MESNPGNSTFLPVPQVGALRDLTRAGQRAHAASPTMLIGVLWHETVATFVTHSGPVLVIAWVGLAAAVATILGLGALTDLTPASAPWLFLTVAVVALLMQALAHGALAWIGLRGDGATRESSLAGALRAGAAGWRGLLTGAGLNAALTFACALSITPFLLSSGLVAINLEPVDANRDGLLRLVATRGLDTAALGVLPSFGEWVAPARGVLHPLFLQMATPDPKIWIDYAMANHMDPTTLHPALEYATPMAPLTAGLIALAGVALAVAGQIMLCFYAAAAVSGGAHAAGALGPLRESTRLGVWHARLVVCNSVALRLLARALEIVCLVLTTSVTETMVLPMLAHSTGAPWLASAGILACITGSAAVSALLAAFCAIYDARLYIALTGLGLGGEIR